MSLVNIINLCLVLSQKELFDNLSFQVEFGDRLGLVGPNGSGKTTLLRLLSREISPDNGEIAITSGARIGYLPQDVSEHLSGPLLSSVMDSIPSRASLRKDIKKIELSLKQNPAERQQVKLATRLAEIHNELSNLDDMYPSHKAEKILEGLGFKSSDFDTHVSALSGGWRMRAALAAILYLNPDLLLLDEPTNYLDLPSVRWLDQFLQDFKGAIILVCHDKEFLNRQVGRVLSFEREGIRIFRGNYDQYIDAREEENRRLEAEARNQEQKVKEAKKFIDRFRYKATKARQAQSKIKLLKKMEMIKTHKREKSIHFSFPEVARGGRVSLTIKDLSKSFEDNVLYNNIDLTVLRGERVALIGPNGFGKTTLLRMIAGEIDPDKGSIVLGHNVEMSYYAQHHSEMLDTSSTIINEVYRIVPHESVSFVRGVCGAFLFSGDDVDKPIKVLSGGEKARVALAKMLIKPGNLLVMDEPTNHLDLISSEILIDALEKYQGTLLFVSHNQSFVNRLATKIWDIRDKNIIEYPGTLPEYYLHLDESAEVRSAIPDKGTDGDPALNNISGEKTVVTKKEIRRKNAEERLHINSLLNPIKDKLAHLEERISFLEKREKEVSGLLADPELFKNKNKSIPLLNEYRGIKDELDESLIKWEENQNRLEELKKKLGLIDNEET
jgi:ATP-binding cassette subfamily F protein 3